VFYLIRTDGSESDSFRRFLNGETPTTNSLYEYAIQVRVWLYRLVTYHTVSIYLSIGLQRLRYADRIIENVRPYWVREVWEHYIRVLVYSQSTTEFAIPELRPPHVLQFGNAGGVSDMMLPEAAQAWNCCYRKNAEKIAVVVDVSSLEAPHQDLQYHAVTGPSLYSICEFSRLFASDRMTQVSSHNKEVLGSCSGIHDEVITEEKGRENSNSVKILGMYRTPPSVKSFEDSTAPVFCPRLCQCASARYENTDSPAVVAGAVQEFGYQGRNRCSPACTVIGFVGRLMKVKSPSLFLQAAKLLLTASHDNIPMCPMCVFVVIGGGLYRPALEQLAQKFGISDHVEFIGEVFELLLLVNSAVI
jgi:glycosyltransferase involved in cell wall biosynthesis